MYSYATRGLGFLVHCATISRQLGQGRQRSGGSPLFMLNICLVYYRTYVRVCVTHFFFFFGVRCAQYKVHAQCSFAALAPHMPCMLLVSLCGYLSIYAVITKVCRSMFATDSDVDRQYTRGE